MNKKQWLTTATIMGGLAIIPATIAYSNGFFDNDTGPAAKPAESAIKVIGQGTGYADDETPSQADTLNNLSKTSTEKSVEFNENNTNFNELAMGSTSTNVAPTRSNGTSPIAKPAQTTPNNTHCMPNPDAAKVGIKHYPFPEQTNLVAIGGGHRLHPDAATALKKMIEAARKDGVTLTVGSAFRGVEYQKGIINRKKAAGQSAHQIYHMSAPAGYSEHHTGFAVDFSPINSGFAKTKGYTWLKNNANKYGFQQTFTAEYARKSGVSEESWHWKYVESTAAQQALASQKCY